MPHMPHILANIPKYDEGHVYTRFEILMIILQWIWFRYKNLFALRKRTDPMGSMSIYLSIESNRILIKYKLYGLQKIEKQVYSTLSRRTVIGIIKNEILRNK